MSDPFLELPERFRPHVVERPEAPELYVECGRRYWDWSGLRAPSTNRTGSVLSVWAETTKFIAADLGEQAGRLYIVAAAGVEATLPEIKCGTCFQPVVLVSRAGLDELIRTAGSHGPCGRCDSRVQAEVAKLLDPDRAAIRLEKRRVALANQLSREADLETRRVSAAEAQRLQRVKREAVEERYPVKLTPPESVAWDDLRSKFETELGVLAVLDYSPDTSPIPPSDDWEMRLCPDVSMTVDLLSEAVHARLLHIHPASKLDAFVWAAERPGELTERFYPTKASWYVGLGPSVGVAAETLQEWVTGRCRAWLETEVGVADALEIVRNIVVAEALRYLDDQLSVHNLPEVPENHRARLREAAQRLAQGHSLGQGYSVAWRAARNAATMAQRHPYAPAINATAHAVNTFEGMVFEATSDASVAVPVYREDSRTPLSALTRTLFLRVLEVDPMGSSAPMIEKALRSAQGFPKPSWGLAGDDGESWPGAEAESVSDADETSQAVLGRRLHDAVSKLHPSRVPTAGEWETFFGSAPELIAGANGLDEAGIGVLTDGVARMRAFRAVLEDSGEDTGWVQMVALAHLLPGVVLNTNAEELALGEVLGDAAVGFVRSVDEATW